MMFVEKFGDLADFAKMLGIDLNEEKIEPDKKTKNQKAADEIGNILKKYGG